MGKIDDWIYLTKSQGIVMVRIGYKWFSLEAIGGIEKKNNDLPILVCDDDGQDMEFIITDIDDLEKINYETIIESSQSKESKN
tara:strand:+ start:166 stop:414 length:249 start_codon:yes stop_codon:yes gene_type:complete